MIDMNMGGFKSHLDAFSSETRENFINQRAETYTKSMGGVINDINACLNAYSEYCANIDKIYNSTLLYLNKAYYNISECEAENTVAESEN